MKEQLVASVLGAGVSMIVAILLYWVKEGFTSRKEQVKQSQEEIKKVSEHKSVLEREIFDELAKIYDKISDQKDEFAKLYLATKEQMHDLDKYINTKISAISTTVEIILAQVNQAHKEVAKIEGKTEELLKSYNEYRGEIRMNEAKFDRIFQFIDSRPRQKNDPKNLGRELDNV